MENIWEGMNGNFLEKLITVDVLYINKHYVH